MGDAAKITNEIQPAHGAPRNTSSGRSTRLKAMRVKVYTQQQKSSTQPEMLLRKNTILYLVGIASRWF